MESPLLRSPAASKTPLSSPAGTPTKERARTPITMTPRSKIAALLKDMDDSDSEPEPGAKSAKPAPQLEKPVVPAEHSNTDEDDSDIDNKLTQSTKGKSRPQRQATKKALFEMQKETQRLARTAQLNVVPEVAKKHSLQSFFDVFDYKPQTGTIFSKPTAGDKTILPTPPTSSSPPVGEQADKPTVETAEESNPFIVDEEDGVANQNENGNAMDIDDELPTVADLMLEEQNFDGTDKQAEPSEDSNKKVDKGKGKATDISASTEKVTQQRKIIPVVMSDDSDSDLEIVKPTINLRSKSLNAVSTGKSSAQSRAIHDLRRLAGINSREDSEQFGAKLHQKQLMADLAKRSREQARLAEEEKKAKLRASGHYVPTAEELQQDKKAAEDIWEKHQAEAQAIREREKKDEAREKGVRVLDLTDDSENDSDWLEDADGGNNDDDDVELSGSDDEAADVEEGEDDVEADAEAGEGMDGEPTSGQGTPRLSDMPETYLEDEADDADESADENEVDSVPVKKSTRRNRTAVIADESDDEGKNEDSNVQVKSSMPEALPLAGLGTPPPLIGLTQMFNGSMPSQVVQASDGKEAAASDLPLAGLGTQDVPMGLTQMFEASMAEPPKKKNNMDMLRQMPDEIELPLDAKQPEADKDDETQFPINLEYSQSQIQYEPESLVPDFYPSQMSQFPDPTPDPGFQSHLMPAPPRFDSPQREEPTQVTQNKSGETVATVPMSPSQAPRQKKGRLVRRLAVEEDDEEEISNAFSIMKKAAARQDEDFDKSKSNAKEMVEEDAEESEDEYAGLGGRSDDEDDDDASEIENLINDDEDEKVDEREVAGLYRKMEGEDDMRNVQDLMKRLENGGLKRRRAGGLFDLSDSEDEVERRVRARRRKEARLRSELLKESGIKEIANNPKANPFYKTLEDHHRDRADFLDQEEITVDLSQTRRPLEPTSANGSGSQAADEAEVESDSSAKKRRRAKAKSHADVKRSVSNLLDDGSSAGSLQVEEAEDDEEEDTTILFKRRKFDIDDRMALKRTGTVTSESTRMAFHSASAEFKVPALLRRSTTSQLSDVSQPKDRVAGGSTGSRVGGGGKASASINWCQRENTRRKLVEKHTTEKKTEQKKMMGKRREGMSGLMGQGGFS